MSHFTVIVVGDDIDTQMEPFAEQDFAPQYGVFEDKEDEYRKEYAEKEIEVVVLADGSIHSKYEEQFKDTTNWNSNYIYPSDAVIRNGKYSELYPTFEEFMEEWHGSDGPDEETGRYGYRHNPNAKWDWYVVGGRWTGFFKPNPGVEGEIGESGAFGNKPKDGWVDSLRLCDIDFAGMKENAVKKANETYDKLEKVLNGRPLPSWNATREKHNGDIDAARADYHSLQVVQDLNKADFHIMGDYVETFTNSREEYVEKCKNAVAVPYAFVKDSKWYQKGEMGWFGMSHGEMTQEQWNKEYWEMLNSLDPETVITLVDCHI